jgi:Protein of unknown function (DUF2877)
MSSDRVVAIDVGVGVRELTAGPGTGTVLVRYGKAAYVRCSGGVFALTSAEVPPGPIHLRCRVLPDITTGEPVSLRAEEVAGAGWAVDLRAPSVRPTLPDPGAFAAGTEFALDVLASLPPAQVLNGSIAAAWPDHADILAAGDLRRAAELLGGRGPGLTPAWDDVLAGLLLAAATLWGPGSRPALAEAVAAAHTNDIAAAFLRWAARGQGIAPVHDLLYAVARGDAAAARRALGELRSFGASSGTDLAYGLMLALRHLPRAPPG